jgi:hypothetical protein
MQGQTCKRGKGEKSDGKKDMQYTFIKSMGGCIKRRRKWAQKGEQARKVTERKMGNMHLLEAGKANFKGCGKKGGKRIESDGKKGGKKVRRVRKGRKERWTICIY